MTQVIEFLRIWYPIFLMLVIIVLSIKVYTRKKCIDWLDEEYAKLSKEFTEYKLNQALKLKDKPNEKHYGC